MLEAVQINLKNDVEYVRLRDSISHQEIGIIFGSPDIITYYPNNIVDLYIKNKKGIVTGSFYQVKYIENGE